MTQIATTDLDRNLSILRAMVKRNADGTVHSPELRQALFSYAAELAAGRQPSWLLAKGKSPAARNAFRHAADKLSETMMSATKLAAKQLVRAAAAAGQIQVRERDTMAARFWTVPAGETLKDNPNRPAIRKIALQYDAKTKRYVELTKDQTKALDVKADSRDALSYRRQSVYASDITVDEVTVDHASNPLLREHLWTAQTVSPEDAPFHLDRTYDLGLFEQPHGFQDDLEYALVKEGKLVAIDSQTKPDLMDRTLALLLAGKEVDWSRYSALTRAGVLAAHEAMVESGERLPRAAARIGTELIDVASHLREMNAARRYREAAERADAETLSGDALNVPVWMYDADVSKMKRYEVKEWSARTLTPEAPLSSHANAERWAGILGRCCTLTNAEPMTEDRWTCKAPVLEEKASKAEMSRIARLANDDAEVANFSLEDTLNMDMEADAAADLVWKPLSVEGELITPDEPIGPKEPSAAERNILLGRQPAGMSQRNYDIEYRRLHAQFGYL